MRYSVYFAFWFAVGRFSLQVVLWYLLVIVIVFGSLVWLDSLASRSDMRSRLVLKVSDLGNIQVTGSLSRPTSIK